MMKQEHRFRSRILMNLKIPSSYRLTYGTVQRNAVYYKTEACAEGVGKSSSDLNDRYISDD